MRKHLANFWAKFLAVAVLALIVAPMTAEAITAISNMQTGSICWVGLNCGAASPTYKGLPTSSSLNDANVRGVGSTVGTNSSDWKQLVVDVSYVNDGSGTSTDVRMVCWESNGFPKNSNVIGWVFAIQVITGTDSSGVTTTTQSVWKQAVSNACTSVNPCNWSWIVANNSWFWIECNLYSPSGTGGTLTHDAIVAFSHLETP